MKSVYGIVSIIMGAFIILVVLLAAHFIINHRYAWCVFVLVVLIDTVRTNASKYHFAVIKDGLIVFRSLNPFRKQVAIAAYDNKNITVVRANAFSYLVTVQGMPASVRVHMHSSEFNKLFNSLSASGFKIETRGNFKMGI